MATNAAAEPFTGSVIADGLKITTLLAPFPLVQAKLKPVNVIAEETAFDTCVAGVAGGATVPAVE